jgi:nicotinic acid mononucleotide adenylyltransferase
MKKTDDKEKSAHNPNKYIELNPTDEVTPSIKEAANKTAVVTFGRFNPITIGHEKLVNKIITIASREKASAQIYLSHTQDRKKNPLSYEQKLTFAQQAFGPIVKKSEAKTIIQVAKEIQSKFDRLIVVVGDDRVSEFETLLQKYNGKEFSFESIQVVSAGERDPDADDVTGMSASKMRSYVSAGNFEEFKKGLPTRLKKSAEEVYKAVREGMGIMEDYNEESMTEDRQPLTLAQRRKRGLNMRRFKGRIKIAREKAKRRMASPEKLKIKARKKARGIIRDRLMKTKKYKFPATVELEYEIPEGSNAVKEVAKCVAYAKGLLA